MKRWLPIIILVVAIAGLVGWRMAQKSQTTQRLAAATKLRTTGAISVGAAIAGPRMIDETLDVVGAIQSPYNVKLSPKVTGLIDTLQVREGDRVSAGQVLVRLDPDTTTATVLQNQANVAQAQQRLLQAKFTQGPTDVGVNAAIRQQRAAVDTAKANLNQVTQNYSARIAAAQSAVTDGTAKVKQAQAAQAGAEAGEVSAQATLANAQSKLNRDLDLYHQNFIAAQDVDDQKAVVAVAKAQVSVAQRGVDAAKQAVQSALAQREATKSQLDITRKQADADIAVAKAAVVTATQALRLANSNSAQAPAYRANLDALRAAVAAAQGTLKASQILARDLNIVSPIDGTVTARTMDPGTIAQPGTPILTIQFLKWVYFNASVPIEQGSEVRPGQKATVTIDAIPNRTFVGTVAQVNSSADPTSHQFLVLVKLDNADQLLRPGMYGHISIVARATRAEVTVPREAVTTAPDGSSSVMVIDSDNTVHQTAVTLGRQDAHGYEVLSGLKASDKVVSLTYQKLQDGRRVNITAISRVEPGGFGFNTLELKPRGGTPPSTVGGGR